jgi:hypothetical protein
MMKHRIPAQQKARTVSGTYTTIMRKQREYSLILILFASALFFVGCYQTQKSMGIAYWTVNNKDSIEIKIPFIVKGRGNVHQLNLNEYEFERGDWIYFSKFYPNISADSLILTHERGKTSYPWKQSNLRGNITVQDSLLNINFTLPVYSQGGEITAWKAYQFNGNYKLKAISQQEQRR